MKILIIAALDSELLRTRNLLKKHGHSCVVASTSIKAEHEFTAEYPDLIFIDSDFDTDHGVSCIRVIRDLEGRDEWVPIVYVTNTSSLLDGAVKAGIDDFLIGPIRITSIIAKVKTVSRLIHMREQLVLATAKLKDSFHKLAVSNIKLEDMAMEDGLTGLPNRRNFDYVLDQELMRSYRNQVKFSLLMIDIDYFKQYNDSFGHQKGDECLKVVSNCIRNILPRKTDFVARYGGEEFSVVLPITDLEGSKYVGEKIRSAVEKLQIEASPNADLPVVTVSIGCADILPDENTKPHEIIEKADVSLYEAKAGGRNRVHSH